MRLLTRHILRSLAPPFFWGVVALTGLLLLNQLSTLIDRFGGKGIGVDVMIEAVVLALPAILTLTLPMAVLVSALYAYSTLAADLEMVAMYASGVSVWRMARPALIGASVIVVVNFLLFDQIVPRSNIRFRALSLDAARKTPTLALQPQALNELNPTQYILRAATIEPGSGEMTDVTIYDLGSYDGRRVIHAPRGRMAESPNGTDLLLTLYDGDVMDVKVDNPGRLERTHFLANNIRIRDVANELQRGDEQLDRGDREMSGCELLDEISKQRWDLADATRLREFYTLRDLRQLVGLSLIPNPPAQIPPKMAPHCGRYRDVEGWFTKVMLPRGRPASDTLRPASTPGTGGIERPRPTDAGTGAPSPRARLPQAPITVAAPRPQDVPPIAPAPTTVARADSAPARDSSTAAAPVPTPPQDSILKAVVPTEQHTPSNDSALALALRQQAMNAQQPPPGAQAEVTPPPSNQPTPFLVPPGTTGTPSGVLSTMIEVNAVAVQANRALSNIRQFDVEYHKKFAIPLASFCFVLLGVALALKYPRSGIGLVIGASLLIFMTFYVLLIGGENVANKGYIAPVTAMHGPLVLFTLLGLVAVYAANREMGTARSGGVVDALFGFVRRLWRKPS